LCAGAGATHGHMVRPLDPRGDGHGHANDDEEHEHDGPPGIVGEADQVARVVFGAARGGYYGADEGDDPGKLLPLALSLTARGQRSTHNGNRNGGQRKGIADDAADAEGRPLAVAVSVFHFAQRRSTLGAVRGHVAGEGGQRGPRREDGATAGAAR
jgi:hypothetical protein